MTDEPEIAYEETSHAGPELYLALMLAQQAIHHIAHDDTMEVGRGKRKSYASTEGVMTEARQALHAHGLLLIRGRVKTYPVHHRGMDKYQNEVGEALVVTYFRLIHADSAQHLEFSIGIPATLRNGMPADKAAGSAITYATRYAAIGILFLPRFERGEEPEHHNDSQQAPPQGQRQAQGGYRQPPPAQQPQSAQKPAEPTRGAVDTNTMVAKVNQIYMAIEGLGDQPERIDLQSCIDKPWKEVAETIRKAGTDARGALLTAMLRVEDELKRRNVADITRPQAIRENLDGGTVEDMMGHAKSLANVADIAIHGNPQTT